MVYGLQTLHHQDLIHGDMRYAYSNTLTKYLFPHVTSDTKIKMLSIALNLRLLDEIDLQRCITTVAI